MKIVSECHVPIFHIFREISRQRALRSGQACLLFYIIQLVLKWFKNAFQLFKMVLELFECHLSDPYITANRNFVCFCSLQLGYFQRFSFLCNDSWAWRIQLLKKMMTIYSSGHWCKLYIFMIIHKIFPYTIICIHMIEV